MKLENLGDLGDLWIGPSRLPLAPLTFPQISCKDICEKLFRGAGTGCPHFPVSRIISDSTTSLLLHFVSLWKHKNPARTRNCSCIFPKQTGELCGCRGKTGNQYFPLDEGDVPSRGVWLGHESRPWNDACLVPSGKAPRPFLHATWTCSGILRALHFEKIRELSSKMGICRKASATCAFRTAGAQVPVQHFTALFLIFIPHPQHPIWKRFIVIKEYTSCFHVAALWICSGLCILHLNSCTLKLMGDLMCKASDKEKLIHPLFTLRL